MKHLIILYFLLFFHISFSQIKTAKKNLKKGESIFYYDKDFKYTSKKNAEYYLIINLIKKNKPIGEIKNYYRSGSIRNITEGASYFDKKDDLNSIYYGKSTWYYETGEIEIEENYVDGKREGKATLYYKSGEINVVGNYVDDKLEGKETEYYESGEIEAVGNYVDGEIISVKCWDEDGNVIECE